MDVDWVAVAVAGVTGTIAIVIAYASYRASARSADASETSAVASKDSAKEAAKLTQIESQRRQDEREDRHELLAPALPREIETTLEQGSISGHKSLFANVVVTSPRNYRAHVVGWTGTSMVPVSGLDLQVLGQRMYKLHIEHWAADQEAPHVKELRFKFWPPMGVDESNPWSCACGRPTSEDTERLGHWEIRLPVERPRRPRIRILSP
ncbi:hypothetical protein ACGFNP_11310 [Nonomuraea sp. NPDC049269]|uniref:hypothetical protein n=1 Tax=Nonomuraea sp. NPDC049269 TaxID=3364349 RepID=UPI00371EA735